MTLTSQQAFVEIIGRGHAMTAHQSNLLSRSEIYFIDAEKSKFIPIRQSYIRHSKILIGFPIWFALLGRRWNCDVEFFISHNIQIYQSQLHRVKLMRIHLNQNRWIVNCPIIWCYRTTNHRICFCLRTHKHTQANWLSFQLCACACFCVWPRAPLSLCRCILFEFLAYRPTDRPILHENSTVHRCCGGVCAMYTYDTQKKTLTSPVFYPIWR